MAKKKSSGTKCFGKASTRDRDDAPELLANFFRDGEVRHGNKLTRTMAPHDARRSPTVARRKVHPSKS